MKTLTLTLLAVVVIGALAAGAYLAMSPGPAESSAEYRLSATRGSLGNVPMPLGMRFQPLDVDTDDVLLSLGSAPRVSAADVSDAPPTPEPEALNLEGDAKRLHAITKNWMYLSMSSLGGKTVGSFIDESPDVRDEVDIPEGETYKGVRIAKLTRKTAVVELGDASETLDLNPYAKMFLDPKEILENPDLYTSEEYQKVALERYWRKWGNAAMERAKSYTPKPGEIMPPLTPPSPEQVAEAKKKYEETYGEYFRERAKQYTPAPGVEMPTELNYVQEQLNVLQYEREHVEPRVAPTPSGQ